jgi:Fe-S-cluster containining protein
MIHELPVISNNETPDICAECGGGCCKNYAGMYHPEQVVNILKEYADTGFLPENIKIDAWEETERIYMLRPAHKNSPEDNYDLSWGGECVNFTENKGCSLSFENRPLQCQGLVCEAPNPNIDQFSNEWSKLKMMQIWKDYQNYFIAT